MGRRIGVATQMRAKTRSVLAFRSALLAGAAVSVVRGFMRRRRREAGLRQRSEALSRANAELQAFTSMASHELQEPMRKIVAFGDLLRRHAGNLSDEGRQDLDRIQSAAHRMVALTEALLRYSRLGAHPLAFERLALGEVVSEALVDVDARVSVTKARVETGTLPEVWGDETQLRQLMVQLLTNAMKFQEAGARPEISISASDAGSQCEVRIADNGIGFDAAHADRIFEPFGRLHPRARFEGAGMGLATARRIAERHGGTLTAETRRGGGSVFVLRLPKSAPDGGPA